MLDAARKGVVPVALLDKAEAVIEQVDLAYLGEEIPKAIQQSLEGVGRVAKIVQAMKEFSHPGTEQKTPCDINRAIENTITVARNEWKYVAEMVTDLDPSLPPIPCFPGELNQVVLNLIVNAAHAIAEQGAGEKDYKGTITVQTRHLGDRLSLFVRDTGCGIPAAIRARIFEPFFTTKPVGKGTGQGLAIAHAVVVKKHGGTITVESEVGKGTTFEIRLPTEQDSYIEVG
jgi:signal transduction histidine kinase